MLQAVKTSRRDRCKSKSRARRYESTQKPSGTISRRVQKVGGEHFAIVCVDPAKHRSEWMMADYFGGPSGIIVGTAEFSGIVEALWLVEGIPFRLRRSQPSVARSALWQPMDGAVGGETLAFVGGA